MKNVKFNLFSAGFVLAMVFTFSCSSPDDGEGGGGGYTGSYGSVTYSGKTYKTVKIGTQTWMAENLNYDPGTGNSACYDNQASNCVTYGRLYDLATAMGLPPSCNNEGCSSQIQPKHRGICPAGWHIPSDAEWGVVVTFAGGESTAGAKLKAKSGWNSDNGASGNGTDEYGFSALPGGLGNSDGSFYRVGYDGYWWSASESAYSWYMNYSHGGLAHWYNLDKSDLFSVRCLQD